MRELPLGILSTLLPFPFESKPGTAACCKEPRATANIINGMRPQTIGRAMGIGLRVAGRIAGQKLAAQGQSGAAAGQSAGNPQAIGTGVPRTQAAHPGAGSVAQNRAAGRTAEQIAVQASRGIGGFLRPFRRVGGILWLEVTGAFFLLFAAAFAFRLLQSWASFSLVSRNFTVGAAVVFLYLGVSSFWRARRR